MIVPFEELSDQASRMFHGGLRVARGLKSLEPSATLETNWVSAASFPRKNGSGTPLVTDPAGNWVIAMGTWFHTDGYATGAESVLLSRYLEVGPVQLGQELEGFFSIVIGDAKMKETIVLSDIVGSCHCFVRVWQHSVTLSSSSQLLAGLGDFGLDQIACQEFLSCGVVFEDRTIYQEVRKLPPASVSRFAAKAHTTIRYWRITDLAPESLGEQTAVSSLWEALVRAAQKTGRSQPHPVCDLTGGYDSRSVFAAFLVAGVEFSTVVSGPEECGDVLVSKGLAQLAKVPHLHMEPPQPVSLSQVVAALPFTDGEYDLVEYSRVLWIHQSLMQRFSISINGSFGEVARGYWWELLFPRTGERRPLDLEKIARLRYAVNPVDPDLVPRERRLDLISHLGGVVERTNEGLTDLPNTLQMDHAYLVMRMQRWQGRIASSTNQLWPCLSPFLFRSVLETMLQTPATLRRRSLLIRKMLAKYQPKLAAFPLEHGYPALPANWKTFYRFWPLSIYYGRKTLNKVGRKMGWHGGASTQVPARIKLWQDPTLRELLRPEDMRLSGFLDRQALKRFLEGSQRPGFAFDGQWARLLSLECAMGALEIVGSKLCR